MSYFRFATTEPGLNAPFAVMSPAGLITWWNGTAFETYASGHWSTYDIALTEGPPGFYTGEWPSGINQGYYDLLLYETVGGTAATDRLVGGGTEYNGTTTAPELPYFSACWICNNPDTVEDEDEKKYITAGDNIFIAFDFGNYPEIQRGETISTMVLTVPAGVDYSDDICGGPYAMARFSGTASETAYEIEVVVNFSGGSTVTKKKKLKIT